MKLPAMKTFLNPTYGHTILLATDVGVLWKYYSLPYILKPTLN